MKKCFVIMCYWFMNSGWIIWMGVKFVLKFVKCCIMIVWVNVMVWWVLVVILLSVSGIRMCLNGLVVIKWCLFLLLVMNCVYCWMVLLVWVVFCWILNLLLSRKNILRLFMFWLLCWGIFLMILLIWIRWNGVRFSLIINWLILLVFLLIWKIFLYCRCNKKDCVLIWSWCCYYCIRLLLMGCVYGRFCGILLVMLLNLFSKVRLLCVCVMMKVICCILKWKILVLVFCRMSWIKFLLCIIRWKIVMVVNLLLVLVLVWLFFVVWWKIWVVILWLLVNRVKV